MFSNIQKMTVMTLSKFYSCVKRIKIKFYYTNCQYILLNIHFPIKSFVSYVLQAFQFVLYGQNK